MRGFFRSNTFKILMMVLLICSAVLILSVTTGDTSFGSLFGFVTTPLQQTGAAVTPELAAKVDTMSRDELERYCAQLEGENSSLRRQLVDYYELKQENRQFQEALKIQDENLELELRPAAVIGRDPSDLFYGFSIDAGYLDGISTGDPVVTDKGVVGIVSEVYATSGRVTSILSEKVKVGAISKEFMESGVVTGGVEEAAAGTVRMNYLTKESKIQQGTIITTSGSGGVFPKDLIVGKVSYLGTSATDVSLYAVIEPYEDVRTVSDVFVVTNFPGKDDGPVAPESNGEGSEEP